MRRNNYTGMRLARAMGRNLSRFLVLALMVLAGLGITTRPDFAPASCGAAPHACCCIQSGQPVCACDSHAAPATRLASLIACDGASDGGGYPLARVPGLAPMSRALLAALVFLEAPLSYRAAAILFVPREPSSPPPRLGFLSLSS